MENDGNVSWFFFGCNITKWGRSKGVWILSESSDVLFFFSELLQWRSWQSCISDTFLPFSHFWQMPSFLEGPVGNLFTVCELLKSCTQLRGYLTFLRLNFTSIIQWVSVQLSQEHHETFKQSECVGHLRIKAPEKLRSAFDSRVLFMPLLSITF